jgi:hypothetical protein
MIVRDLDDEQMLKFMGRENMEDYNADFLTMLETWEAASVFESPDSGVKQPLEIAKLLSWHQTRRRRISPSDTTFCSDLVQVHRIETVPRTL